jgi:hypothetical protein
METACRLKVVLIGTPVDIRRPIVPAVRLCHTLVTLRTRMRFRRMHGRPPAAAVFLARAAGVLVLWIGIGGTAQA